MYRGDVDPNYSGCGLVAHGVRMWNQLPAPLSGARGKPGTVKRALCMIRNLRPGLVVFGRQAVDTTATWDKIESSRVDV